MLNLADFELSTVVLVLGYIYCLKRIVLFRSSTYLQFEFFLLIGIAKFDCYQPST